MEPTNNATWGSVTRLGETKLKPAPPARLRPKSLELYRWLPGPELSDAVPAGISLDLVCGESESGGREYWPIDGRDSKGTQRDPYRPFLFTARSCGFAILCKQFPDRFGDHLRRSFGDAWFVFLRGQTMRPFVSRRFNTVDDLVDRRANGPKSQLPLPWLLASSTESPPNAAQLMKLGQDYAAQFGIELRNASQKIHHGLGAMALSAPMPPRDREASRRLVKIALFDIDSDVVVPEDPGSEVEGLILDAIDPHIRSDKRQADFDEWFLGKHNSFVKQVAQRLKSLSPQDARCVVTHVLVELAFQSYEHIGQCIQAVMYDFENGLDEPLRERERGVYHSLFYPQDLAGGLPLVLLRDKLEFAEGILFSLLNNPLDKSLAGAFHQLLLTYSELARWRRDVDRTRKQPAGKPAAAFAIDEEQDSMLGRGRAADLNRHQAMRKLIDSLEQRGKLRCDCMAANWTVLAWKPARSSWSAKFECRNCGATSRTIALTKKMLEEMGD